MQFPLSARLAPLVTGANGPSAWAARFPRTRAALDYAMRQHAGQRRSVDDAPFILHPVEVGSLLYHAGAPDHVIAAGILHDTIEKTASDEREKPMPTRAPEAAKAAAVALPIPELAPVTTVRRPVSDGSPVWAVNGSGRLGASLDGCSVSGVGPNSKLRRSKLDVLPLAAVDPSQRRVIFL